MKEKITIYTSESCAYCKQVKDILKANQISFIEKDHVNNGKEWSNIVDLLGTAMLPTISHKDKYFAPGRDFQSPHDLPNILKDFKPNKDYPTELKILERLKTLHYSIHMAFQNTDNILRSIENKLTTLTTKDQENGDKSTS